MSMEVSKLNSVLRVVSRGHGGVKSRKKARNAFSENMPTFELTMKLDTTDRDQDFVTQKLNEITEGLFTRKLRQNTYSSVGLGGGFASLRDIEKTHNIKKLIKKIVKTNER